MPARTVIAGGHVVAEGHEGIADVAIAGERIEAIGSSLAGVGDTVIDASGAYVLPGGIDPHTHIDLDYDGVVTRDDFTSATVAAAFGGTTCVVDFCMQPRGERIRDVVERWHAKLRTAPPVGDVGFHMAVTDLSHAETDADLAALGAAGITSLKAFMAYADAMLDDADLLRLMRAAARHDYLVMVHAENGGAIDVLVEAALAEGHTHPRWHARTRPPLVEVEATQRAICLSRLAGARLYVVHVSAAGAAKAIARARERGADVTGETCPQYLVCDEAALDAPLEESAKFVFSPPPRTASDRDALLNALAGDVLSVVGSDHCPYDVPQKLAGARTFAEMPSGAPGIENRMHVLWQLGVQAGRLSLRRFAELTATNAAKTFGLYPRKGALRAGADADVVIWDPAKTITITAAGQHSRTDHNLYEGMEIRGAPALVLVRGEVVVADDTLHVEAGHGQFVARGRTGAPMPAAGPQYQEVAP